MSDCGCEIANLIKEKANANTEFCEHKKEPCEYWYTCLMTADLSAKTGVDCHTLAMTVEAFKPKLGSYEKSYELTEEVLKKERL